MDKTELDQYAPILVQNLRPLAQTEWGAAILMFVIRVCAGALAGVEPDPSSEGK